MAEEQKPVIPTETAVAETTPAPVETVAADKPAETVEPKTEEAAKPAAEAVAPVEDKKEEKPVEPITSGALGYKAPGLKNAFRFSKKYFWLGDEAVPVQSLSHYLRGEKAEVAHPTAAWSSQTGKGLLYFVKHADEKATPAGVLRLAEATDLSKDGTVAFHFKLHGQKHTFEASTAPERNGWFLAIEEAVKEAKEYAKELSGTEGYKEQLEKLGKPATLAATAANKEGSTPKKSTDVTPKPAEGEAVAEGSAPARAGSSSSSSSDEDKKKKKAAKSKSRSVSRGKRTSIFGGLLAKKDKLEEKKEEKKEEREEKKEEKKEEKAEAKEAKKEEATAPAGEAAVTAPVIPESIPPVEPKAEETAVPAVEPTTEAPKEEKVEKPKPTKRGSIFGNFASKLKSPTHEKKESEVVPAAPAKDSEIPAEAPKLEETPAVAPLDGPTETPKVEETKPTAATPNKEKESFSFGKFLGGGAKEKAKTPTGETKTETKTEEPAKAEETPAAAAAVEPTAEAPKTEEAPIGVTSTATAAPAKEPKAKRGSIFGGLLRNASKVTKPKEKKEKEAASTPEKVEETPEPKEETPALPEKKDAAVPAATEPTTIGDVVPDAVTVGQAPKSTPEVSASA